MIQNTRILKLNNLPVNKKGSFVVYWMQATQRIEENHALEYAIEQANEVDKPLVVFFGLTDSFPEANERHYFFMLEGLKEVEEGLKKRGIKFVIQKTSAEKGVLKLADEAAFLITDRGYLVIEKKWRRFLIGKVNCPFHQVESNVVVPVEIASDKEEYGAYTIRPKITRELKNYLHSVEKRRIKLNSLEINFNSITISDIEHLLDTMTIDKSVKRLKQFKGGTIEALRRLKVFIDKKLDNYESQRNNPVLDFQSDLSPYLHFGQISPIQIALSIKNGKNQSAIDSFLEQVIIRRELSINFVFYNEGYGNFETLNLPRWANQTLQEHEKDKREYLYTKEELELAKTHDEYWNAAQKEMIFYGKMHNYMRMYWGKKIIEWTQTPKEAHEIALYLNNKYELDGRDANGFTGIAWCFGKHDRPWMERPIFGKVRYMNAAGLERKFEAKKYVEKVEKMIDQQQS